MSKLIQTQDAAAARKQLQDEIRQSVKEAQIAAERAAKAAAEQAQTDRGILAIPAPPLPPIGTPGVAIHTFPDDLPPRVENIAISFFIMIAVIVIGLPLMRAIARRIERGTPVAAPIPREVGEQLQHITQSVDAIAIEVERISEGQRFTTKMLADRSREGTA
jgi:hypothetical protein